MEIIILIAVIGLIGNIIKAMNKSQQTTPPQQYPIRKMFEDIKIDPIPSIVKVQRSSFHDPEKNNNYSLGTVTDEGSSDFIDRSQYKTNMYETTQALHVVSLDEGQNSQYKLEFSQDNILNGIIFSEILGPPKSRRR